MRFPILGIALLIACSWATPAWSAEPADDQAGEEFFERKIRPLLVQHCYSCHGRGQKKGGLSLESREGLLAGGESGAVAVPDKPETSLLIEAVSYEGDVQMPPNGKLADDDIAALRRWLALGIPWPAVKVASGGSFRAGGAVTDSDRQFWSFQPVRDHAPPAVKHAAWPRRSLDYFVLQRLEAEDLQTIGEADRRSFIRRATFDLVGLPPTAEEIESFAADDRPNAYERLIDRLLESPHYGERWARHWLDVARYGEDQAHKFKARMYPSGYRYRDWVVAAFNHDLPFDRFVIEQIAGDLLDDSPDGSIDGGDRMARLPALGFFALGPVYYGDAGCAVRARADEYDDRVDTLCRGILGLTVSCARCHDHKFDPITMQDYYALAGVFASSDYLEAPLAPPEVVKRYDDAQARLKQAEQRLKDAQVDEARKVGESLAPQTARYFVAAWKLQNRRKVEPGYKVATAAKEAVLHDFLLEHWLQFLADDATAKRPWTAPWRELLATQDAKQDLSQDAGALTAVEETAQVLEASLMAAIDKRRTKASEKPPALDKPAAELLKLVVDDGNAPLALPKGQVDKHMSADRKQFLAGLEREVGELKKSLGAKYPIAHSLTEGKVANLQIHLRGSPTQLGDEAPRRFLSVLSPAGAKPFEHGSGRLELARAIASRDNPLTARVFVNRVWQQHFGRGIVGTPSNFGLLGERPTHPELLDHLTARFIASGWSVKQLHREIMLSATYRLSSTFHAANHERDPENRLLWRMNRRRLEIEAWHDAVLAASGNLDLTLGGPSVDLNDANNRRRTLYAAISRHDLNPMLRLFDFPDPNLTSERRVTTTVPMQQLFVLNSEFMIRQAKTLVERLMQARLADDEARIEQAYRWVLGRAPRDDERQIVRAFLANATATKHPDAKLTAWEQYAQVLLSTNEFLFVD